MQWPGLLVGVGSRHSDESTGCGSLVGGGLPAAYSRSENSSNILSGGEKTEEGRLKGAAKW